VVEQLKSWMLALTLAAVLMLVFGACSSTDIETRRDGADPGSGLPPDPEPGALVLEIDEGLGDFLTYPAKTGVAYITQAPLVQPKTTVGVHFFDFGSPLSTDPFIANPLTLFSEPGEQGSIVGVDEAWVVYQTPDEFQRYDRSRAISATNPEPAGQSAIPTTGPFGGTLYADGWFVTVTNFTPNRGYELYVDDVDDGLGADVQMVTDSADFSTAENIAVSEAGIAWVTPSYAGEERVLFRAAPFDGSTSEIVVGSGRRPMISGDFLLFVEERRRGDEFNLFAFDTQSERSRDNPIRIGRVQRETGDHTLSGPRAVWIEDDNGDDQVFTADLLDEPDKERRISERELDARLPAVSGDWVTWAQCRDGASSQGVCSPDDSEIVYFDVGVSGNSSRTILSSSNATKSDPSVSSAGVAWSEGGNQGTKVLFFDPTRPLESDRNPAVVIESDDGDRDPRMIDAGMYWYAPLRNHMLRAAEATALWDLVENGDG
jgi:hypothetical protein